MEGSLYLLIFGPALSFVKQPIPAPANVVDYVVDVDAAQFLMQLRK